MIEAFAALSTFIIFLIEGIIVSIHFALIHEN